MTSNFCWLIGGSVMSVPMCKEIKRRGYGLLRTDKDEACVCREYADKFVALSVYDEVEHVCLATVLRQKTVGVLCIGCDAGPTVSAVCEALGLPGGGYEVAMRAKDKGQVRRLLGAEHPAVYEISSGFVDYEALSKVVHRAVVKPINASGSRGFTVVEDAEELKAAIEKIEGDYIVEELLLGKDVIPEWREKYGFETSEVAMDFFVEDGIAHYANGALRMFWADQPGIEAGHINPFVPDEAMLAQVQDVVEKLGVKWGPFKCDFMQDERYGWVVMECATRLSGGFDHMYTAPLSRGRDVTGGMLDMALGGRIDHEKLADKKEGYACAFAPRFRPGKVEWRIRATKWAVEAMADHWFILAENEVKPLRSNQDRPLFFLARGDTMDQALKRDAWR